MLISFILQFHFLRHVTGFSQIALQSNLWRKQFILLPYYFILPYNQEEPTRKPHQIDDKPITEWNTTQVSQWLLGNSLEQYINDFTANNITGTALLQLDGPKLKVSLWSLCLGLEVSYFL